MKDCMDVDEIMVQLRKPFGDEDVAWRVMRTIQANNGHSAKAIVVPYVKNRAIQNRLDEVFGVSGWENVFKEIHNGVMCGIKVWFGDRCITKWDGADLTDIESTKGGISTSMKRAAVQWGIGRYIYSMSEVWVEISKEKTSKSHIYLNDKKNNIIGYWLPPQIYSQSNEEQLPSSQQLADPPSFDKKRNAILDRIKEYEVNLGFNQRPGMFMPLFKDCNPNTKLKLGNEVYQSATLEELIEFYSVLKPVNDILRGSDYYKIDLNRTLEFVQIIKPEIQVEGIHSLFTKLNNEDVQRVLEWFKSEVSNHQTA